jgi:serine phosphatase RsbU (regulator of sigma subunit)
LVGGLTYLIVQWRTNNLIKARELLQNKVEEKTYLLQKEKEEVEKIKVELERHNKEITDSINYARRIQDSLLPPEELLNGLFKNNYFIFYKPKDIVSGDFYWAAPNTTNTPYQRSLSLAAVADCTGHGVPGAFLSIVATNFLKLSLSEKSVNSPSEALDFLNVNITSSLNQSAKGRMRDGMDIAMIAIDYERLELYYSGANNAIYIFRRSAAGTEIIIQKSTKRAIGDENANAAGYELKKFDLQTGDTIYLFSDGFADQFGGDRDKKLNYKRFKEILTQACELPITEQDKFLEQKFENWRGITEQTDDVCVMGICI